jgi:hypothetical protein
LLFYDRARGVLRRLLKSGNLIKTLRKVSSRRLSASKYFIFNINIKKIVGLIFTSIVV